MASFKRTFLTTGLLAATALYAQNIYAQGGPGPNPGPPPPTPNRPPQGLTATELAWFQEGAARFTEVDSVAGTQPGAAGVGLGPRFNGNSCAQCHAHPGVGGSSPQVNPQIAMATNYGARNVVPAFLQQNGPVRVVRFAKNADGSPDGGVHDLFVVTGRSDATGCSITQPDFATAVQQKNASFRIPTPVFGAGLIEAITESTILANLAANGPQKQALGIRGHENRNGNDGTITRFGWKAQNKSLLMFAGEAYNVEQGVTNELFPNERDETANCGAGATPEDHTNLTATTPTASMSDLMGFVQFMRFLPAPPAPQQGPAQQRGSQVFAQIGCAMCHTPVLQSGLSTSAALSQQPVALYSDLAVHKMGVGLADGIVQGQAQGDDWRSAPLWGLGSRLFFLHDGRTSDLDQAIQAHQSAGSEANAVVDGYNRLSAAQKQDLLTFLHSL